MSLKDLTRIDSVSTTPDGATRLAAIALDWTPESLRLSQLAIKLDVMKTYGEQHQPYQMSVACFEPEAPESAIALTRAAGGEIYWTRLPITSTPGEFASDPLDWPAIHAANATLFAQQHGLDGTVDSLRRLDEILEDAYTRAAGDPDEDGDAPEDGDLAVLAGAYASEVMLAEFGGRWNEADPLPDFRLRLGRNGDSNVGMAGKVRKFLRNGPGDAVHPLAMVLAENVIV